ncbi:MAG: NifU family protein [Ilumatobacteraceae bacterium]
MGAADATSWATLAPHVQSALVESLDELDRAAAAATEHWGSISHGDDRPDPTVADIQRIVDRAAGPVMLAHGGALVVTSVDGPSVRLRTDGNCHGCGQSNDTVLGVVAPAIVAEHPRLVDVTIDVTIDDTSHDTSHDTGHDTGTGVPDVSPVALIAVSKRRRGSFRGEGCH